MFKLNPIVVNKDGSLANTQTSFFNAYDDLPERYKKDLLKGWAGIFRILIMPFINEKPYSVLYSDYESRPNVPVNYILGALIIKMIKGIATDDDLRERFCYDVSFRYALCCEHLRKPPFSDNILTNFRQACIVYYIDTGIDLIYNTFLELTDSFSELMDIDKSILTIDSTMVDMYAKNLSRLDLLYINNELIIQEITGFVIHKRPVKSTSVKPVIDINEGQLTVLESDKDGTEKKKETENKRNQDRMDAEKKIPESLHNYLHADNKNKVTYHLDVAYEDRINAVIADAQKIIDFCEEHPEYKETKVYSNFVRIINEQCKRNDNGALELRAKGEGMGSGITQSPYDTDATYRDKDKQKHRGYSTAFTQARNEDGESLVMDYNVDKNNVSDQTLGADLMKRMETANPEDKAKLVGDGLFNSDEMQEIASEKNIEIINTNLTGKKPADHCADHEFNDDGSLKKCAGGHEPVTTKMNKDGSCTAKFEKEACVNCPFKDQCKLKEQKRYNSLKISTKTKERAQEIRNRGNEEFKELSHIRNGVETIPSMLKNKYHVDKIRGGGLPTKTFFIGIAYIAINVSKVMRFLSRRIKCAQNQGYQYL